MAVIDDLREKSCRLSKRANKTKKKPYEFDNNNPMVNPYLPVDPCVDDI